MNQMNEWIRTFSQHFNDILQGGYDSYNNPGNILFTGKYAISDEQYDFPAEDRYDLFTYETYTAKVQELVAGGMTQEEAKKAANMTVDSGADPGGGSADPEKDSGAAGCKSFGKQKHHVRWCGTERFVK